MLISLPDIHYLNLVQDILNDPLRTDRTGVGTHSTFAPKKLYFNLEKHFPLLLSKKVNFKAIVVELLWFLKGSTNISYLHEHGVHIWDDWADEEGNLGPVYGKQWRDWQGVDQIANLINSLRNDPFSRRHIVTAWNPLEINEMALPPCHCLFQFYVKEHDGNKYLSCQLYQRSADLALGVPFNIASYSLLTCMIAQQVDMIPHEFIWCGGDVHIYANHVEGLNIQLTRKHAEYPCLPRIELRKAKDIFSYELEDISLMDYQPADAIRFPIAV